MDRVEAYIIHLRLFCLLEVGLIRKPFRDMLFCVFVFLILRHIHVSGYLMNVVGISLEVS